VIKEDHEAEEEEMDWEAKLDITKTFQSLH